MLAVMTVATLLFQFGTFIYFRYKHSYAKHKLPCYLI